MMKISVGAIYTIWLREMKRFVRAKSRIVAGIATPFFFLAFLGFGFNASFVFPGLPVGLNYMDFLSPGIVAMVLLFSSMFAGISVLWDRQFGFLKEIMVAPVSRTSIVLGRIMAGITTGVFQAILILLLSILMGFQILSAFGLLVSLVFIILISSSFVAVGLAFASKMEDMQGFQIVMNFFIMPVFLLSGALFPIENLPAWLAGLSYINPLTYGVDGLRSSLIGVAHLPILLDFGILLAFCIVMVGIGTYLFSKTEI
jgi:ABC-2 type transport system permease protein